MYPDAALETINKFCDAQDGKVVKQRDDGSFIKDTRFSITYADTCRGSGSYKVSRRLCKKYLQQTVKDCDKSSTTYKHGGTVTDIDNCGAFQFHPTGLDRFACYPYNRDYGYITQGTHVTISPEMAEDAITRFCDRDGDGQTHTLDPAIKVDPTSDFSGDTCKEKGAASCGYFYTDDGKLVTEPGNLGHIAIRMNAAYLDHTSPGHTLKCEAMQKYEIHGDRCKANLRKVLGNEPKTMCIKDDPRKLDLGSFVESSEKGCVLWSIWAVDTR